MKSSQNKKRKAPPKSNGDVNYKNQVKQMFSDWFKNHNRVGYVMSKQDIVRNIITKLTSKQENSLEIAIKELNKDGYIELQEDGLTLVLTQKGVNDFKKMSF
ncbi:hypothetical protein GJV85_10935 [Sulfurimonas aquatica]|uniref:Uncharacterized protein n=1 Tax=Sulfurimonas aquatica TaxID=2672570 RepID=A0A975B1W6_9BACT|nr:hypothetical protein [Sulfurimonas aquatica]QSZ42600.1 hypothetical protein GJV85_10935 [Sulfurimonas aquatica]